MRSRAAWLTGLSIGFVPVFLAIGLVIVWQLQQSPPGLVGRNVTLAGASVEGMDESELRTEVRELARRYAQAEITVDAPEGGFRFEAPEIDLRLDEPATVAAALETGTSGSGLAQFASWLRSLFGPRAADVHVTFAERAVFPLVSERDPGPRSEPAEPSIGYSGEALRVVRGRPGKGIDAHQVIDVLPVAADAGVPIRVEVDRGVVYPRFDEAEAEKLIRQAEDLTEEGLGVTDGQHEAKVPPERLRSWLGSEVTGSGLRLFVVPKKAAEGLRALMPEIDREPVHATFAVTGDRVTIVPGQNGLVCCAEESAGIIERALLTRTSRQVKLPLAEVEPDVTEEDLEELGIVQQVSTFTTNHASGQNRVENIHRIADLIRGQIIPPGGTFSVNEFVGKRTREKGFVVDGVIENGRFTESVGGGISQFATTLFNAAFFAGLDFPEYQSHSIYISRYPYGREATLSYPKPDLKIANPSPNSVLIWPTYTDSSITVSLYSTPWAHVEQSGQTRVRRGPCTLVRTERMLVYAGGRTETDQVIALYRPAEGVNCR